MGDIDIGEIQVGKGDGEDDEQAQEGGKEFAFEHITGEKEVVESIHKDHMTGKKAQVGTQGLADGTPQAENKKAIDRHGDPEQQVHEQALPHQPLEKIDIHEFGTAHGCNGQVI